jgi:hypothetical protein
MFTGLKALSGLLEAFWDHLYPVIEDDDLDYRIGPCGVFERQAVAGRQAGAPDRPCSGGRRIFMDQVAGSHRCRER